MEGQKFDSHWDHWDFSLTLTFRPHYGPGINISSNRNEYHGISLGERWLVHGADNLATSCADCLQILEAPSSSWPKGLSRPAQGLLYLLIENSYWITKSCWSIQLAVLNKNVTNSSPSCCWQLWVTNCLYVCPLKQTKTALNNWCNVITDNNCFNSYVKSYHYFLFLKWRFWWICFWLLWQRRPEKGLVSLFVAQYFLEDTA
jgi:hypothetical protein